MSYVDGYGYITNHENLYKWNTHFYAQSGTIGGRPFYKSDNGRYGIWYDSEGGGDWMIGPYEQR